ncbi:MAG TPA: hypothetical protein VMT43_09140 [Acidimicrobiales bacterium]|nr:hypothetical protein [Acidimicrobiales bacterium]
MLRSSARAAAAVAALFAVLLGVTSSAFAHEVRKVGAYQLTVGWQHEPVYAGAENGVQVFVHDAGGAPIDDLGNPVSLKVQVIYGTTTSGYLDLEPSFDADTGLGTHGEWNAAITPTEPGNYTFHLTGSIRGQAIDQKFTSGPETFNSVDDPTSIEFPTKTPSAQQQAVAITRLQSTTAAAASDASSAKDSASTATTVGIVAIVIAVVLGGVAIGLAVSARKGRSSA